MIWALLVLLVMVVVLVPLWAERSRRQMDDTARGSAPGGFAELPRGVTHFQWYGPPRRPVAVCIHGLTTPGFVWQGLARGLTVMGYRVLTYDLYGRGFSDRPRGRQDRAFFVQQLEDLLAHEGVDDDITVVGYSMGGAIAACFAATNPGRVRQMALIAPAGMGVNTGRLARFMTRTRVIGDWMMLAFYPTALRRGVRAERGLPGTVPDIARLQTGELAYKRFVQSVLASLRGILGQSLHAEHAAIRAAGIPVTAIWGAQDRVIPRSAVDTLSEWNPDTRHEVIEGAGHGLTYTHTEEILARLRAHWPVRPSPALRAVPRESPGGPAR